MTTERLLAIFIAMSGWLAATSYSSLLEQVSTLNSNQVEQQITLTKMEGAINNIQSALGVEVPTSFANLDVKGAQEDENF